MPWGKCDDSFYDHPKVRALPVEIRNDACGLYWRAISFANRHLTDGRLTMTDVLLLDGTLTAARSLVRVRLWERSGKAYRVHDFLSFNKSREQVLKERDLRSDAGRLGGLASGRRRQANPKQNGSTVLDVRLNQNEAAGVELPSRPVRRTPLPPKGGRALKRDKGVEGLGSLIVRIAAEGKTP